MLNVFNDMAKSAYVRTVAQVKLLRKQCSGNSMTFLVLEIVVLNDIYDTILEILAMQITITVVSATYDHFVHFLHSLFH